MAENELLDLKNGPRWDRLRRLIKADAPTIDLVEVCVESIFSEVKWLKKKGVPFREVIDILCRSSSDAERAALLRKYRLAREAVQTLVALSRTYPDTAQLEREFWQRSIRRIFQQQRIPAARKERVIYFPDFNAKLERVMKGLEPKLNELTRAEPSRLRRKYRDIISRNPRNRPEALLNESLLSPTR